MVVALHLEHHRLAIADVDDAGVLARSLDHPRRLGRQAPQVQPRGFVRAMLVPHRRENPEFSETRHPPDQLEDALIFVRLETMAGDEFGSDLRLVHAASWREGGLLLGRSEGAEKAFYGAISRCP